MRKYRTMHLIFLCATPQRPPLHSESNPETSPGPQDLPTCLPPSASLPSPTQPPCWATLIFHFSEGQVHSHPIAFACAIPLHGCLLPVFGPWFT